MNGAALAAALDEPWQLLGVAADCSTNEADTTYQRLLVTGTATGDHRWAWRVLRDPYYRATAHAYRSQTAMVEAGFLDDGAHPSTLPLPNKNPRWFVTPTQPVERGLATTDCDDRRPKLVLLSTGAFSPIHDGHVAMLEQARRAADRAGWNVLAGYLSPSHDAWVSRKAGGSAACPASVRVALCEDRVADSEWIAVDPWESLHTATDINFTEVVEHLRAHLRHLTEEPLEVAYVFGSDNAAFARAFVARGLAICVPRSGYDAVLRRVEAEEPVAGSGRLLIADSAEPDAAALSSTFVRSTVDYPPRPAEAVGTYALRDDLDWAISSWASAPPAAIRQFAEATVAAFTHAVPPDVDIRVVQLEELSAAAVRTAGGAGAMVLSLDAAIPGDAQVGVSRVFEIAGAQRRSSGLVARPGRLPIPEQLASIPAGAYTLIDDDVATGATILGVTAELPPEVQVVDARGLMSDIVAGELYDVCDLRDFLLGAADAGLVVRLGGDLIRVPYLAPYTSLRTRAKLPAATTTAFSQQVWEANVAFFTEAPELTVADADPAAALGLRHLGWPDHATLLEVATWHLDKLSRPAFRS